MTHSIHLGFSCASPSAATRFESPEATPPPVIAPYSDEAIAQTIIGNERQFGRRDLARDFDHSYSDDALPTSDGVFESAQVAQNINITKAEAEELLTDYAALMKHRFIAEVDTEDPDRWNVSSVTLPRDMRAQYNIGIEGCGDDILQMDSSELLTRLMQSQFDEE